MAFNKHVQRHQPARGPFPRYLITVLLEEEMQNSSQSTLFEQFRYEGRAYVLQVKLKFDFVWVMSLEKVVDRAGHLGHNRSTRKKLPCNPSPVRE